MANDKRLALRKLPPYDPDNNIGAVDRVRFAMINNRMADLTQPELIQVERWRQIDDWIRSRRYGDGDLDIITNHRKLRNVVMSKYDCSWDTAERDIRNAKDLFKASHDDTEYSRSVYIEQIEENAAKAARFNDFKAYAKLMELAAKLRGHFEAVIEEIPYDKLEAFQFIIEYNPEAIGLTRLDNPDEVMERWRKKKQVAQKLADDAEDAEYV